MAQATDPSLLPAQQVPAREVPARQMIVAPGADLQLDGDPLLDVDLPPLELGEPPELPPLAPPDPTLLTPLTPLEAFDTTPRQDFQFTLTADDGLRYRVGVDGLGPTGLGDDFRHLSALYRGQNRTATAAQIASRANADVALMQRLLFSEGWYGAEIEQDIRFPEAPEGTPAPSPDAGPVNVQLTAVPGDRYRWRDITLDLIPDDLPHLKADFGLKVGDPVRAIKVEEAEGALKLKLNQAGYPFAEIGVRDVVLDAKEPTATYLLTGQIGPLGRFGRIHMGDFRPFDAKHAAVIARFSEGDRYDAALVDDFRRALIATQLFGGVTAVPVDSGERNDAGEAITDIEVQGHPGPHRRLGGQVGYSTGEGIRAEAMWQHRNLWQPEGRFTGRAVVGTIEQRLAAEMVKSNFGLRDLSFTLMADVANMRKPAYRAQTITLGAELARNSTPIWQKPWTYSIGVELQASREEMRATRMIGDEGRTTFLIAALPGMVARDSTDDLLDPQRGYRLALTVVPEISRQRGHTDTYVRLIADGSAYQRLREDFVLAGRVRAGSIMGVELENIAPTRRLYAGGGGSVRGFEYQGIGPVGDNNRPIGGRGLAEASVEGRYRFGNFGVVAFVDAGTISSSSSPTLRDPRFGAGLGARYYTSFGPMRVDIARAINKGPRDPKIALYISIGQAF